MVASDSIDNTTGLFGVITDRLDYLPKGAVLHGGTTLQGFQLLACTLD